ncbi:gp150 protein, partial [Anopheles darlingi]
MRHQLLLVLTVSLCAIAVNSSPALKPDLPKAKDPLFDKMLAETSGRPTPDAHDPRFNKMLPDPDNNLIADDSDEDDEEEEDLLNDDILPEKALDLNPKYAQKANKDKPEVSTVGSVAVNKVKINEDIDNYEAQLLKGNGKKLPVIAIDDDELPQVEDLAGEIILPLVSSTNLPLVEITSSPSSTTAKASTTEGDESYDDDDEYDDESDEAIDFSGVDKVLAQPI